MLSERAGQIPLAVQIDDGDSGFLPLAYPPGKERSDGALTYTTFLIRHYNSIHANSDLAIDSIHCLQRFE